MTLVFISANCLLEGCISSTPGGSLGGHSGLSPSHPSQGRSSDLTEIWEGMGSVTALSLPSLIHLPAGITFLPALLGPSFPGSDPWAGVRACGLWALRETENLPNLVKWPCSPNTFFTLFQGAVSNCISLAPLCSPLSSELRQGNYGVAFTITDNLLTAKRQLWII